MDFFARQDRARRSTVLLIAYFVGAVVLIVAAVDLVAVGVFNIVEAYNSMSKAVTEQVATAGGVTLAQAHAVIWQPQVIACATIATLVVILGGSLYKIAQLSRGGRAVAEMLGATPVLPGAADPRTKMLRDVVEEMAIASGVAVPAIYVMAGERGINAFAAGLTQQDAVICVTGGCLDRLSRDQLQGIIAHEFSHILNSDIRLNLRLVGALYGILVVGLIGYGLIRGALYSTSDEDGDWRAITAMSIVGIALMGVGFVGFFFGRLIQAAVCRQREFLADASAVQFTRQPGGLAGALKLVGAGKSQSRINDSDSEQIAHMFFASSMGQDGGWMATHPPLGRRILALESTWDGTFPKAPEPVGRYASTDGIALDAAGVAARVGAPTPLHVKWASDFIRAIPAPITEAARNPFTARAIVFAILLGDEPEVREKQLQLLSASLDQATVQETLKLAVPVAKLGPQGRRVVVDLAIPALRQLSSSQCEQFAKLVNSLIDADGRVTLFEYMLTQILAKNITAKLPPARPQVAYYSFRPLIGDIQVLLSALAAADPDAKDPVAVRAAFDAGIARLQFDQRISPLASPSIMDIDSALERLSKASPAIKRRLVEACAFCVAADGLVQAEEGELLRAVTSALECPLPPLLAERKEVVQHA
jgi:Zn-dependent protease with chaperone function